MISCVEWIPKGAADPTPKRYELSAAELAMLREQAEAEAALAETKEDESSKQRTTGAKTKTNKTTTRTRLPEIDPSSLPADLRMDEYSSDDDDDDDDRNGARIGDLLIGNENSEIVGTRTDEKGMPVEDFEDEDKDEDEDDERTDASVKDDDDSDDDSDDDVDDGRSAGLGRGKEDLREYVPVDVEGLEAMRLDGGDGALYLDDEEDDENDSDKEDTNLSPDDALIVVAKTEEDFATLAVHVYETKTGNLFVHHDVPLPAFPLCLAHGDVDPAGGAGNFCAVGTFDPGIEIWNLDVLDVLEPTHVLGGVDRTRRRTRGDGDGGLRPGSHTDAVLALDWNKAHRQIVVSGGADRTVRLWDVTRDDAAPASVRTHHSDKVNAVAWHPTEGALLATGSFDRTVALVDARADDAQVAVRTVRTPADCEAVRWDPFQSHLLVAASEDGTLSCWDVRRFVSHEPVWSFVAHEFGVSDFDHNGHVPGMIATCSVDRTVALWDARNASSTSPPVPCGSKEMNVGRLFATAFWPSSPWLLGCGGDGNELSLWDMSGEDALRKRFGDRISDDVGAAEGAGGGGTAKEEDKEEDLEAAMLLSDAATRTTREEAKTRRKKKKKGKNKNKKVHKVKS